jgi:hypothetical protein
VQLAPNLSEFDGVAQQSSVSISVVVVLPSLLSLAPLSNSSVSSEQLSRAGVAFLGVCNQCAVRFRGNRCSFSWLATSSDSSSGANDVKYQWSRRLRKLAAARVEDWVIAALRVNKSTSTAKARLCAVINTQVADFDLPQWLLDVLQGDLPLADVTDTLQSLL